jgi:glycerol-3-phosphate acyltransferase PlsY
MDGSMVGMTAFAYLLGGIPTGYLIARRAAGIDIREHGSGNPGAANVYRVVGRWAGWATLAVDASKGYIPVMLAKRAWPDRPEVLIGVGAAAIVGHIWTIYLQFRGGKGVATSCGVFAALLPVPTLAAFGVFIAAVAASGHISVGSMLASATLPAAAWWLGEPPAFTAMGAAVAALILVKHIPNLRRLLSEKEARFRGPDEDEGER